LLLEKEVWKEVEGYEGYYEVSNLGHVRSLDRVIPHATQGSQKVKGKVLKQTLRNKYYRVILARDNHKNHQSVHRIVAKAFIPNPENKESVDHINNDKLDNRASNLNWVTVYENSSKARREGFYRVGEEHLQSKITAKEVKEILDIYYIQGFFQSQIASLYNVEQATISKITRGVSGHFDDPELVNLLHLLRIHKQENHNSVITRLKNHEKFTGDLKNDIGLISLFYKDGVTHNEIGKLYSRTGVRVGQLLKEYNNKII